MKFPFFYSVGLNVSSLLPYNELMNLTKPEVSLLIQEKSSGVLSIVMCYPYKATSLNPLKILLR